ncbi:MAG: hypothetical protein ABW215_16620 [Kibdelosporangium sp.]
MRRTIRRGLTLSAAATCALVGLGFSQASAAPIPVQVPDLTGPVSGLTSSGLPGSMPLHTLPEEIGHAPLAQLPATDRLPVVATVEHNNLPSKVIPNTEGVSVQGVRKPHLPDVAAADALRLPNTPATHDTKEGMQSVGLPAQLPGASVVDTTAPSLHDLTGAELPELPELPEV